MHNPFESEVFGYWLVAAGSGVLIWLFGFFDRQEVHPISLPRWLLLLCGIRNRRNVGVHRFAVQMLGFLYVMWTTMVVLFVAPREERMLLVATGDLVLLLLVALFVAIVYLVDRKSEHK